MRHAVELVNKQEAPLMKVAMKCQRKTNPVCRNVELVDTRRSFDYSPHRVHYPQLPPRHGTIQSHMSKQYTAPGTFH